ncbi:MAG: hypothetical protein EA343_08100 [Nodularia sp. (in: Bacteria)]|nr:MAG: hypothetical protein EA343_08100 [Nodularia sp. (in: cyanobacteria)]
MHNVNYEVIVQILGRSPQGFTPFEILDHLLALPQYQGRSRSSIFAELLPVLQSLRDSQEVAHVSPRWVLVETQEKTSGELSNEFIGTVSSEETSETEAPFTLNRFDEDKCTDLKEWTPDVSNEVLLRLPRSVSFETQIDIDKDKDTELGELLGTDNLFPEEMSTGESLQEYLYDLLDNLTNLANFTNRERDVIMLRFGLLNGHTCSLTEIGCIFDVTRERVRQIESKAKKKLNKVNKKSFLLKIRQIAIEALRSAGCINNIEEWCEDIAQIYPRSQILGNLEVSVLDCLVLEDMEADVLDCLIDLQVKIHVPSFILWIIDFIPEIHSIQISAEQFFYIAPFTNQVFENIQVRLIEFWKEQRFSDRSQLNEIILPLLPEEITNYEQATNTLIKACCNEPIPGILSKKQWNLSDYAYYVIYEAGKALHFSEIGQRIKQLKPDWKADNLKRAAQGLVDRHPDIIRSGSGTYGLREWGTMEYGHFREVLLDYLSKQSLPVDPEDIYIDLSQSYVVTRPTVTMNLSFHPNLFKKFGRSNLYGVPGRLYELPEQNLINLLVAKLEASPVTLSDLEQDIDLSEYDAKTIYLYLNVSPIFCQTASNKERKFALSIEGKRQYKPGDGSKIVANIFNQICEPLHAKDILNLIRNSYAYPPGEQAFWRILTEEEDYISIAEAIFIPQKWWSDETLNFNLEDLDTERLREIALFTVGSKRQPPPADILFDWLNFCYRNRFFYRGSLVFAQINLSELSDKKAQITRKIGQVCQRNGDTSVLAIGQDANSEEVERILRLDLEDLQQQAQSVQRTQSKGLASIQDGQYRVRYVGVGVEVHITKYGGTDNPCASVLQVLVNSELYDPSRHNPIPANTATIEQRREALQKLYKAKLTAYGQVDSYLQVAIGSRPSWGIGYRQMEPITEQATEDVA